MPAIVRRCSHNFYRNLNPEATYRSSVILWGHNFVNWCTVEWEEGSVLIAPKYLASEAMFVNTYFYFWYWKGRVTKSKYSKSLTLTTRADWEMVFVQFNFQKFSSQIFHRVMLYLINTLEAEVSKSPDATSAPGEKADCLRDWATVLLSSSFSNDDDDMRLCLLRLESIWTGL